MKHLFSKVLNTFVILGMTLSVLAFSAKDSFAASKPKYIAHRGWSSKAPENTLPAFKLAAKNKHFYGIEFDIWESSAQKTGNPLLLVMHDENIKRMCGVNKSIRNIKRANRKKYKIKNGNNLKKYTDLEIPTAEQALNQIRKYSKGAIPVIELKHRLSGKALNHLFDLIGNHKAAIISFDYAAVTNAVKLAQKRGIAGNIQTMFLLSSLSSKKYTSMARKLKKDGINSISLKYTSVNKTAVKIFHKYGIKVSVWTLPNKAVAKVFAKMGVDYITANSAVY